MAARAGAEWQRAEAGRARVAALLASRSWRAARPLRVMGWLLRRRPGAALVEAGVPPDRMEALRLASGTGLGAPLRGAAFLAGQAAQGSPALLRAAMALRARAPWATRWAERRWRIARAAVAAAEEAPLTGPDGSGPGGAMAPSAARRLRRIAALRRGAGG